MKIENAVIGITGASSGIGRASALELARGDAVLALIARREEFLSDVAAECKKGGARDVLVLPVDVSEENQVKEAVSKIIDRYGQIDVWINNAAVTMFGRFEKAPPEDFERVIRTNLFGYVHAARAVLPHLREQGRGALFNVSSVVGYLSQPHTSAYCISKAGIIALSNSLRQELSDAPDIHVCTVLPSAIDTPQLRMAANYTGRGLQPIEPVYPAEKVACAIVHLIRRPRREITVGNSGRLGLFGQKLLPGLTEKIMTRVVEKKHLSYEPAPQTKGNLFVPVSAWNSIGGGWRKDRKEGQNGK